jgi:hypothetical protein
LGVLASHLGLAYTMERSSSHKHRQTTVERMISSHQIKRCALVGMILLVGHNNMVFDSLLVSAQVVSIGDTVWYVVAQKGERIYTANQIHSLLFPMYYMHLQCGRFRHGHVVYRHGYLARQPRRGDTGTARAAFLSLVGTRTLRACT